MPCRRRRCRTRGFRPHQLRAGLEGPAVPRPLLARAERGVERVSREGLGASSSSSPNFSRAKRYSPEVVVAKSAGSSAESATRTPASRSFFSGCAETWATAPVARLLVRRDAQDRVLPGEPRQQPRIRRRPQCRGRCGPGAARREHPAPPPARPTRPRAPTCAVPARGRGGRCRANAEAGTDASSPPRPKPTIEGSGTSRRGREPDPRTPGPSGAPRRGGSGRGCRESRAPRGSRRRSLRRHAAGSSPNLARDLGRDVDLGVAQPSAASDAATAIAAPT